MDIQDIPSRNIRERLVVDANGCWIWTGGTDGRKRYGRATYNGQKVQVHRQVYLDLVGPLSPDQELDHVVCKRTLCANPEHVEPTSHLVNMRRGHGLPDEGATHCPRGHVYSETNAYTRPNGWVDCRECTRVRQRNARL